MKWLWQTIIYPLSGIVMLFLFYLAYIHLISLLDTGLVILASLGVLFLLFAGFYNLIAFIREYDIPKYIWLSIFISAILLLYNLSVDIQSFGSHILSSFYVFLGCVIVFKIISDRFTKNRKESA